MEMDFLETTRGRTMDSTVWEETLVERKQRRRQAKRDLTPVGIGGRRMLKGERRQLLLVEESTSTRSQACI